MEFFGDAEGASPGTVSVRGSLVYDAPFELRGNFIVLQLPNMGAKVVADLLFWTLKELLWSRYLVLNSCPVHPM